jgi:hypothetical protein
MNELWPEWRRQVPSHDVGLDTIVDQNSPLDNAANDGNPHCAPHSERQATGGSIEEPQGSANVNDLATVRGVQGAADSRVAAHAMQARRTKSPRARPDRDNAVKRRIVQSAQRSSKQFARREPTRAGLRDCSPRGAQDADFLAFAMADLAAVPPLLSSQLSSTFTRFLCSHTACFLVGME